MSDTATSPTLDTSVAWLAAYALGLAYSEKSDQQRLTDLLEATRCPQLLDAAHQRLYGSEVTERSTCDEALHLLDRAMVHRRRDLPPTPDP